MILNFRSSPGGTLLGTLISDNVKLTAVEWTTTWFKVDYMGEFGWISADYVITNGECV